MTWSWNESGRIDSFEFEKISNTNLNTSLGKLECLVTGGTLTYSYFSDLKVSGSLDIINAPSNMAEQEYLIRIWYTPQLNGERKKIELGTFYFDAELHYENGMYKGTLNLRSMLARHLDDLTIQKWTIAKNSKVSANYKKVFKALGGFPKIDGVKDSTINKNHIFDVGVTPMEILQYLADTCGGEITVDTHGRTVLKKYLTPKQKAKSISTIISANAKSVVKAGMDISNTYKQIPNRVVCIYETGEGKNSKQYIGKAALDKKEARSFNKIGKWITNYYKVNNCKTPYVQNLNKLAATKLARANSKTIYYTFNSYYQPLELGEVIKLKYDDIVVKGLVSNIELDLAIGLPMKVKIRKV